LAVTSDADDAIVLRGGGLSGDDRVFLNDVPIVINGVQPLSIRAVTSVEVNGGPGDNLIDTSRFYHDGPERQNFLHIFDRVVNTTRSVVRLLGNGGNDTIIGSQFGDFIDGGPGADKIFAGLGDDVIVTDGFDAVLDGGGGWDRLQYLLPGNAGGTLSESYDATLERVTLAHGGGTVIADGFEDIFIDLAGQSVIVTSKEAANVPVATTVEIAEDFSFDAAQVHRAIRKKVQSIDRTGELPGGRRTSFDNFAKMSLQIDAGGGNDSISIDSALVPVTIFGGPGNDIFDITPGPWPITVNGGEGADLLTVNHGGYAFKQSTGTFEVATKARVNFSGIENTQTTNTLIGDPALEYLRQKGVVVTAACACQSGTNTERYTIVIENQGAFPLEDISIDFGAIPGLLSIRGGPGLSWEISNMSQQVPTELQLLGLASNIPNVRVSVADLLALGQQAEVEIIAAQLGKASNYTRIHYGGKSKSSNSRVLSFNHNGIGGRAPVRFSTLVCTGTGDRVLPASTNPTTGKTAGGASEAVGATALGVPLLLSTAPDIDPDVVSVSPGTHVYLGGLLIDRVPGTTNSGNGKSYDPQVTADGRYVTFMSEATDLVPGEIDTNGIADLMIRDNWTGAISYVAKGKNIRKNITVTLFKSDKTRGPIVFTSPDSDIVPALSDANGEDDLFAYDISTGKIECLSLNADKTATANKGVHDFTVDAEGTPFWVTAATDLVPGGGPAGTYGVQGGANYTVKQFHTDPPTERLMDSQKRIPKYGQCMIFASITGSLSKLTGVPDTNGVSDLFAWYPAKDKVYAISVNASKTDMGNGATFSINQSGTCIFDDICLVESDATDLVPAALQQKGGVYEFAYDPVGDTFVTTRLDKRPGGGFGGGNSNVAISPDGRFVAFTSKTDYSQAAGDLPHTGGWLVDSSFDITYRIDATDDPNNPPDGPVSGPLVFVGLDSDVLFTSAATNLVPGDGNGGTDAFLALAPALRMDYFGVPAHPDVTFGRNGLNYEVVDSKTGVTLLSRPVAQTVCLFVHGLANSNDTLRTNTQSGLSGLAEIFFDGGTGGNDQYYTTWDNSRFDIQYMGEFTFCSSPTQTRLVNVKELAINIVSNSRGSLLIVLEDESRSVTISDHPTTGATNVEIRDEVGSDNPFTIAIEPPEPFSLGLDIRCGAGNDTITVLGVDEKLSSNSAITIDAGDGNDVIDASKFTRPLTLFGGLGDDTITGGLAVDAIDPGTGRNTVRLNNPLSQCSCPNGFADNTLEANASFGVNFGGFSGGVDLDITSTATQTIAPNTTIRFTTPPTEVTGSDFGDTFRLRAGSVPATGLTIIDPGTSGAVADALLIDAQGKALTDLGGKIVGGSGPVFYAGIEGVTVSNNAPGNHVVVTQVNDGSIQRSRVLGLTVAFNGSITFAGLPADAFLLVNQTTSTAYPVTVNAQDINGFTNALLTFTGPGIIGGSLPDGKYTLTVLSTGIAGGLATGDALANFHRLFGDVDGDADVDATDFGAFRLAFGTALNLAFDFDGDGDVDAADFGAFRQRFGVSL
jgi:hypothetical protein